MRKNEKKTKMLNTKIYKKKNNNTVFQTKSSISLNLQKPRPLDIKGAECCLQVVTTRMALGA